VNRIAVACAGLPKKEKTHQPRPLGGGSRKTLIGVRPSLLSATLHARGHPRASTTATEPANSFGNGDESHLIYARKESRHCQPPSCDWFRHNQTRLMNDTSVRGSLNTAKNERMAVHTAGKK
jgi:hypothetical protein